MPLGYRSDLWGRTSRELQLSPFGIPPAIATAVRQARQRPKSLRDVIPDDPNYQKIPIEYRLDAKGIVGDFAQDLQQGKSAHVWAELAHWGIGSAEMAGLIEGLGLAVGTALTVAGPVAALAALLTRLGAPYQEIAEKIAKDWSASGYSRGAVMGADQRPGHLVREYWGNLYFPQNPTLRQGANIARLNHNAGLVAGFVQGRALTPNQRQIFFRDLGRRMLKTGDLPNRPRSQWRSLDWQHWYRDSAIAFRRHHLTA
jgi:hypothetical protein